MVGGRPGPTRLLGERLQHRGARCVSAACILVRKGVCGGVRGCAAACGGRDSREVIKRR